jgi:hypothetical protein
MIRGYSHLLLSTVDELLDIYLTNLYLWKTSHLTDEKTLPSFVQDLNKQIDHRYMSYVELSINIPDVEKFRQTILDHTKQYDNKELTFGIDSNPILGQAIRLFFDQLHSTNKKSNATLYRSIYDEWEPTCFQKS